MLLPGLAALEGMQPLACLAEELALAGSNMKSQFLTEVLQTGLYPAIQGWVQRGYNDTAASSPTFELDHIPGAPVLPLHA